MSVVVTQGALLIMTQWTKKRANDIFGNEQAGEILGSHVWAGMGHSTMSQSSGICSKPICSW